MNKHLKSMLGASMLVVGTAAIGIASAADRNAADAKAAATDAVKANKALARHDNAVAVAGAEHAVELVPQDAGYRLLLGQSYLAAGRFASARTAFADALALAPANGKAALNLALAQIGTGDWAGARRTLDEHGAGIAPADKGLALALAGDPGGAVQLLTQVARSPETSAKVRQNLALSLALAGEWAGARTVAAVDMSPAELDARLEQWAVLAHPHAASDQVAALLSVIPVADHGQPAQLALGGQPTIAVAAVAAPVAPLPTTEPKPVGAAPVDKMAPVEVASTDPATQPGFAAVPIVFGPRAERVQPLPVVATVAPRTFVRAGPTKVVVDTQGKVTPLTANAVAAVRTLRPEQGPVKVMLAAMPAKAPPKTPSAAPATHGSWFVQLGAFGSSAVAHDAWTRAAHRMPALAARGPSGMNFTIRKTTFYRLSVGGFARSQADALCQHYRATGGACFVRAGAGDQVANWARQGVQLAAR